MGSPHENINLAIIFHLALDQTILQRIIIRDRKEHGISDPITVLLYNQ